jgi:TRAP-type C4-dicarboxylate transport system permease small subunit
MNGFNSLVLQEQRHLKWRALDWLEQVLMILCGVAITGFSVLVMCDIVTRTIGHPWLWLQEATMTFFIYGIFIGVGAATRRNDHLYLAVLAESLTGNKRLFFEMFNRLVVLGVAVCMIYFGYLNFLDGFKSLRMPSMTPLSSLYAAIPLCGVLVSIFIIEQMVNGWHNGFVGTNDETRRGRRCDQQWRTHLPDGIFVLVPRLHGRASGLRTDRRRAGGDGVHPGQPRLDDGAAVQRHGHRSVAGSAIFPARRRSHDLG